MFSELPHLVAMAGTLLAIWVVYKLLAALIASDQALELRAQASEIAELSAALDDCCCENQRLTAENIDIREANAELARANLHLNNRLTPPRQVREAVTDRFVRVWSETMDAPGIIEPANTTDLQVLEGGK